MILSYSSRRNIPWKVVLSSLFLCYMPLLYSRHLVGSYLANSDLSLVIYELLFRVM